LIRARAAAFLIVGVLALVLARPAVADDRQLICQTISAAAGENGLPMGFLARLLWTESGFHSAATSPAGAEGVAQFMPQTAALRGLADPRDPIQAIQHAARLLVDLDREFGNLGLAAAAYNAGAARIEKWLRGLSVLPVETRLYVLAITGRSPEDWAALRYNLNPVAASYPLPGLDCLNVTSPARHGLEAKVETPLPMFQVRLDNNLSKVLTLFQAFSRAELAAPAPRWQGQRPAADSLCASIRLSGAKCEVFGSR
jgi:hypothetical protein